MSKIVMAVFNDREKAEDAIMELKSQDYDPKEMSFIMKDKTEAKELEENTGAGDVISDTVSGAGTGAVVGGIAGLLAGTVMPGLAGFFIGGPIGAALGLSGVAATTVSGATTGAVAGGILGALTNVFDLSEEDAKTYETQIKEGGVFIAVPAKEGDEDEVQEIMKEFDAENIRTSEMRNSVKKNDHIASSRYSEHSDSSMHFAGAKGGSTKDDIED